MDYVRTQGRRWPGTRPRFQAPSSSSAPHSAHPGAEGGTRVRQSVLYSDRPWRSRPRRQTPAEEHPGMVSSSALGRLVTDSPTLGALPLIDSPPLTPQTTDADESDDDEIHPGAEGGTRVRQSVLYSDRPRRSQPRRQTQAEEHPGMVSSSELGRLVTDSPTFEALSLIDSPLLTPQTTDAEESDDDAAPPERVRSGFGFRILGPLTLRYSARPPRPKWSGGVLGQGMLEKHAGDANSSELDQSITDLSRSETLSVTVSSFSRSEKPTEDSDDDTEEVLRSLEEYYDAHPPTCFSQAFAELEAANHAALTSLAVEWGIEPPPPLAPPRRQFLADQARQKTSAAVTAHPQHSTVPRKLRQEASDEEIVENAKKWMRDELTLVFQNYIGRREDLKIVDYHLDELRHQSVCVEDYHNIFHHYNFTVKLKKVNSDDWVGALYFAEVKQMFGRKSYFCCPLDPNENGHCYACQNQGVDDLRHPATGGFTDVGYGLWYADE